MNVRVNFSSSSQSGEIAPGVRVLRLLVGLIQLGAIALAVVPWLATPLSRQFGVEAPPSEGPVRVIAVVVLVLTIVARVLLPGGGSRRQSMAKAFSDLAGATGGTFDVEKRRVEKSCWKGGPTARWTLYDTPVTMQEASQTQGAAVTRVSAEFPTAKELRLSILPKNFLTGTLTSPKFIAMVQAGVKQPDGDLSNNEQKRALKEMEIFTGATVTFGDPELDAKLIVKSNDADLARYVLTGGGVTERMRELNEKRKAWTLSLFAAEGGVARLVLDVPGRVSNPEMLRAAKEFVEALLGSLQRNGVAAAPRDARSAAR